MGLGNQNREYDTELVIIEDVSPKDGGKPSFNVKKKIDGAWVVVQSTSNFYGDFKSLKIGMKYNEDDPKQAELAKKYGNRYRAIVELVDKEANETYRYGFTLRMSTRGLINRLLNLQSFDNVNISIKPSKEGKFENFFVEQNKQSVKWKYEKGEFPEPREYLGKGGKPERDYSNQDEFFVNAINQFNGSAQEEKSVEPKKNTPQKAKKLPVEDDIPF